MNNITKEEIIAWIVNHSSDTEIMDEINGMTFRFTAKYNEWKNKESEKIDIGL